MRRRSRTCSRASATRERPATAYRSSHDGLPEPLCAIYEPRSARPSPRSRQGKHCPRKFLLQAGTHLLEEPNPRALDNINTPKEYGGERCPRQRPRCAEEPHGAVLRAAARAGRPQRGSGGEPRTHPAGAVPGTHGPYPFTLPAEMLRVAVNAEFGEWSQPLARATPWCSSRPWPAAERPRMAHSASAAPHRSRDPARGSWRSGLRRICLLRRLGARPQRRPAVRHLEYEAFEALAVREGERIVAEASRVRRDPAACVHRLGTWRSVKSRCGWASVRCTVTRHSARAATSSTRSNTGCRSGRKSTTSAAIPAGSTASDAPPRRRESAMGAQAHEHRVSGWD